MVPAILFLLRSFIRAIENSSITLGPVSAKGLAAALLALAILLYGVPFIAALMGKDAARPICPPACNSTVPVPTLPMMTH